MFTYLAVSALLATIGFECHRTAGGKPMVTTWLSRTGRTRYIAAFGWKVTASKGSLRWARLSK